MYRLLTPIMLSLIFGLPLVTLGLPYALVPARWVLVVTLFAAPVGYTVVFVVTAGLLSRPFQKAIIPGRFPRDLAHPVYRARRLYGLCWTSVFYFKPVYYLCLSIPELKWLTFRLFGYRGSMRFTIYPDTWIRDLPLLEFSEGAYVANRATLGTNLVLSNGQCLVDRISLGKGATVGHLAMLAPGVALGVAAEVGAGCAVGVHCHVGDGSIIQTAAKLNHGSRVGSRATVGVMSYVGTGSVVESGVHLPSGSVVPNGVTVRSRADVRSLISAQVSDLAVLGSRLEELEARPGRAGRSPGGSGVRGLTRALVSGKHRTDNGNSCRVGESGEADDEPA